ncbi:MAG: thymidylate synthase [Burkholderiales bacterium]
MYIKEQTLDDLLHKVISKLLKNNRRVTASRGDFMEMTGVLLLLTNPRARLSRTEQKQHLFSSLGELLWYLSGTNDLDFIHYYVKRYKDESEDGVKVYGGYGPRFLNMDGRHNQVQNVIELLKSKRTSRRAVIQIFSAADIAKVHVEIPCTCTLQFLIRGERLHMFTYMRSNDAFFGLPHDIFAFTMLQEIIARTIGVEIGEYRHAVGSLHLYEDHKKQAEAYLDEGFQSRILMPQMPTGDPWRSIRVVRDAEFKVRNDQLVESNKLGIAPYWQDLVRLLQIFRYFKDGARKEIAQLAKAMASDVFKPYIKLKAENAKKRPAEEPKGQLRLPLG